MPALWALRTKHGASLELVTGAAPLTHLAQQRRGGEEGANQIRWGKSQISWSHIADYQRFKPVAFQCCQSPLIICTGVEVFQHFDRLNRKSTPTNLSHRFLSCKLEAKFNSSPVSLLHCRGLEKLIFCFVTDFSGTRL